jgi:hypothetical protein
MLYPRVYNHIGKVCALVAATLILPVLAYADGRNDQGDNDQGKYSVPEGGPGIVLFTTTIGAILLFSARWSSRSKAS